ncbi:MAG: hypothetical protein HYV09_03755 [Deltaproteobacteria bacterium]|nr:hypothetical protein [Deltaproteobacteria bacterium]
MSLRALAALAFLSVSMSCAPPPPCTTAVPPATTAKSPPTKAVPPAARYEALDRDTFNRLAVRLNLALFWVDQNADGAVQPDEVRTLLFYPTAQVWAQGGAFTPAFTEAWARLVAARSNEPPTDARKKLVRQDLDDGQTALVDSDFSKASADDKTFVRHVLQTAKLVDALFARQNGAEAMAARLAPDDVESQSLFRRNLGPKCATPRLSNVAACSAIEGAPRPVVDVYPPALQADAGFCDALGKRKDAAALLDPFVVVRRVGDELRAVPYSEAYRAPMEEIAHELEATAKDLEDPKEEPLRAYLRAAAQAFRTNAWQPADEAWAKMTAENSRWYLRVGPDEVYWDPCSRKAGFHLGFAKINRDSLAWQARLSPHEQAMEDALAALIGAPYESRKVTFHLPDFVDVVVNAGDDRDAIGATVGQSLPNWGPVANEGRGRTIAMSNLYMDPDSIRVRRAKAESLFTKDSLAQLSDDAAPGLLTTILHEATHNLGPAHEYRHAGKKDSEAFGGELASMLEELKAQSGALFFAGWGEKRSIVDATLARQATLDSLVWCMGQIAQGMWEDGHRRPYPQLAAVQVGFLLDEGALRWDAAATAANGKDQGAFVVVWDKLPAAVERLMKTAGTIKAKNDKKAALALAARHVDGKTVPQTTITERWLRFRSTSFVYAVRL